MGFPIVFFLTACLTNVSLRMLVRFDIPKKHWIKHKSGKFFFDWFLLGFREGERKKWVDLHLAFSLAIPVAFFFGVIGFFIKQLAVLQALPMIVCFLCLGVFACSLLRNGAPAHSYGYGNKRRWKVNSVFAVVFIFLVLALSIYLGYAFIKDLFF